MNPFKYSTPKKWNPRKKKWETRTVYLYTIVKTKYEIFRGYPSPKQIIDTSTEYSVQNPINDLGRTFNGLLQLLRECLDKKIISDYLMEPLHKRKGKASIPVCGNRTIVKGRIHVATELPN